VYGYLQLIVEICGLLDFGRSASGFGGCVVWG
jgi:hypothetical protein